MPRANTVDWSEWVRRWDRQQQRYMPVREERFNVMLDVLDAVLPKRFTALDIGCGPGAISGRLLRRFRGARAIAVDYDPVLLELGRRTLGSAGGRLQWVEADLRSENWDQALPRRPVEAALSTTALHWLSGADLFQVYGRIRDHLRPGGVFLNGDHMAYEPSQPRFRELTKSLHRKDRASRARSSESGESWKEWWTSIRRVGSLRAQFQERDRRFPGSDHGDVEFSLGFHTAAMHAAGFREVGTVWQRGTDRILLGFA